MAAMRAGWMERLQRRQCWSGCVAGNTPLPQLLSKDDNINTQQEVMFWHTCLQHSWCFLCTSTSPSGLSLPAHQTPPPLKRATWPQVRKSLTHPDNRWHHVRHWLTSALQPVGSGGDFRCSAGVHLFDVSVLWDRQRRLWDETFSLHGGTCRWRTYLRTSDHLQDRQETVTNTAS